MCFVLAPSRARGKGAASVEMRNAATLLNLVQLSMAVASIPAPPPPPPSYAFADTASLQAAVAAYNADAASATATYGPISSWGVSAVTNMSGLFSGLAQLNADISSWDTSSVTDMANMFRVRSARALPSASTVGPSLRCLHRRRFCTPSRLPARLSPLLLYVPPVRLCRTQTGCPTRTSSSSVVHGRAVPRFSASTVRSGS